MSFVGGLSPLLLIEDELVVVVVAEGAVVTDLLGILLAGRLFQLAVLPGFARVLDI